MSTTKIQPVSFGQYLVEQGLITEKQHLDVLQLQNKNRLLGQIAIEPYRLNSPLY